MKSTIKLMLMILSLYFCFSCTKDDTTGSYVKIDTDELSFKYFESTQTFTVRASGSWSVTSDDSWIHLTPDTGVSDGVKYENVSVTVDGNTGDERTGTVMLSAGSASREITIKQEDGIFSLGESYITGEMLEGVRIEAASLVIPYRKASGNELLDVTVSMTGDGSAGVSMENVTDAATVQGDNELYVALEGMPRLMGEIIITANITVDSKEPVEQSASSFVTSNNIIFEMTFDKMVWGGDYIANLPGFWPGSQSYDITVDTPADKPATSGQDGTGDYFNSGFPRDFVIARGMGDWDGSKMYEHPGYPKVGTGAAAGWLMSPKLGLTTTENVFYEFNYGRWDGDSGVINVTVEGEGSIDPGACLKDGIPNRQWQKGVYKVTGAGADTRLRITSTSGLNRFFIDNFRVYVSKSVDIVVTEKLNAPAGLTCSEQLGRELTFSWTKDYDASSYVAELYEADGTTLVESKVASLTDGFCTFTGLSYSTEYKCKVKAICASNDEFTSDFTELVSATTLDPIPVPTITSLKVFKKTNGWISFEWDRDDTYPRTFTLELAESADGPVIRTIECHGVSSTKGFYKNYPYNRFVFGGLEADKSYFCRIKTIGNADYANSEFSTWVEGKTDPDPVLADNVLVYKDFNDFCWGGNSANFTFGVCPSAAKQKEAATLTEPLNVYAATISSMTFASSSKNADDCFNTLGKACPEYLAARWPGWYPTYSQADGQYKIYEVTGMIKFGTGSAEGILRLPQLTTLTEPTTIELSFKAAPYTEPSVDESAPFGYTVYGATQNGKEFQVKLVDEGTAAFDDGSKLMTCKNAEPDSGEQGVSATTTHTITINNVTAETLIYIQTLKSSPRMWLDDIQIIKK